MSRHRQTLIRHLQASLLEAERKEQGMATDKTGAALKEGDRVQVSIDPSYHGWSRSVAEALQGKLGTISEFKPDYSGGPRFMVTFDPPVVIGATRTPVSAFHFEPHELVRR